MTFKQISERLGVNEKHLYRIVREHGGRLPQWPLVVTRITRDGTAFLVRRREHAAF